MGAAKAATSSVLLSPLAASGRDARPRTNARPSGGLEHAAADLILFDRFKQGLEVALAEALIALALDELEKDRADHGLGENLQQDPRVAAVDHAFAVDQNAVLFQTRDRLGVALNARVRALIIDAGRPRHEFEAPRGKRIGGGVDVVAAHGDMLDAFALILAQILFDLAVVVGALVDRNADLAARRGQRPAHQTCQLALDAEKEDLAELEGFRIKAVPGVHDAGTY